MRRSRDWLATHTVTVERQTGATGWGAARAQAVTKDVGLNSTSLTVIRDASGDEAVQSAVLYDEVDEAGDYVPGSVVTLPSGRKTTVLDVEVHHDPAPRFRDTNHVLVKLGQRRLGDGTAR